MLNSETETERRRQQAAKCQLCPLKMKLMHIYIIHF